jgi:hypothetical protein
MMGITKQKFGKEHKMSISDFSHDSLFPVFSLHSLTTRNNHQRLIAAPAFWCIFLSFLRLSFRHIPNNLSNYKVLTSNAPFFIKSHGHGLIMTMQPVVKSNKQLTCGDGRSIAVRPLISLTQISKRTDDTTQGREKNIGQLLFKILHPKN